ncbi:MAG: hypothetical protein J3K34DRAFT_470985 [Monoraphidium minutum]|nr:MAG: hypothetical protein J3K34DRAFT_470985 [Monoraphidium minutum]
MQRTKEEEAAAAGGGDAAASSSSAVDVDAALARRRSRRKIEAQVKVESAAVAQATGALPQTPVGAAETAAVQALGIFFTFILMEGLLLAGSGFLPESWDSFIENVLYPSFSPQMLLFLAGSSAYGLWKTGKLPGQKQM